MLKKIAIAIVAIAATGFGSEAEARRDCYAWSQARSIIASEGLMSAQDVTNSVTARYGGKLIGAKLCERNGRFVYDVRILRDGGQVVRVTVNGRNGAHIGTVGGAGAAAASAAGGGRFKKGGGFQFKLPKIWAK